MSATRAVCYGVRESPVSRVEQYGDAAEAPPDGRKVHIAIAIEVCNRHGARSFPYKVGRS